MKCYYCWIIGKTLCDLDTGELIKLKYDYPFFTGYACILNGTFWRYILRPIPGIFAASCGQIDNNIRFNR